MKKKRGKFVLLGEGVGDVGDISAGILVKSWYYDGQESGNLKNRRFVNGRTIRLWAEVLGGEKKNK